MRGQSKTETNPRRYEVARYGLVQRSWRTSTEHVELLTPDLIIPPEERSNGIA